MASLIFVPSSRLAFLYLPVAHMSAGDRAHVQGPLENARSDALPAACSMCVRIGEERPLDAAGREAERVRGLPSICQPERACSARMACQAKPRCARRTNGCLHYGGQTERTGYGGLGQFVSRAAGAENTQTAESAHKDGLVALGERLSVECSFDHLPLNIGLLLVQEDSECRLGRGLCSVQLSRSVKLRRDLPSTYSCTEFAATRTRT